MLSNLRSKPITGHITDNAGNVIRNSKITIRLRSTSSTVDTPVTNDSGFMVSAPLPNGIYAIYDGGVLITIIRHNPDSVSIECFKPTNGNAPSPTDFSNISNANKYRNFIQIESDFINVSRYGNTYPLGESGITGPISAFLGLGADSKLTSTRFDVEYYTPSVNTTPVTKAKRVRFAGVPGVTLETNSRIIVPIDYYSIVIRDEKDSFDISIVSVSSNGITITISDSNKSISPGDIIKIEYQNLVYYGICRENTPEIIIDTWESSRYTSDTVSTISDVQAKVYYGAAEVVVGDDTNNTTTVSENTEAQNTVDELYLYS